MGNFRNAWQEDQNGLTKISLGDNHLRTDFLGKRSYKRDGWQGTLQLLYGSWVDKKLQFYCCLILSYTPEVSLLFSKSVKVVNEIGLNWIAFCPHKIRTGHLIIVKHLLKVADQKRPLHSGRHDNNLHMWGIKYQRSHYQHGKVSIHWKLVNFVQDNVSVLLDHIGVVVKGL